MIFFKLVLALFFLLFSCSPPPNTLPVDPPPPFDRDLPKYLDPSKQVKCRKARTDICEESEDCVEICKDIFSSRRNKIKCYELSFSLVRNFETLLEDTQQGEVEDINPFILECLLDIDDRGFFDAVQKMNRSKARDFLAEITYREDLAEILEDEDDEFNILDQLLYKAIGSRSLSEILSRNIKDSKSFFYLSAEGSEASWKYLNNYINEECRNDDVCIIKSYCEAFLSWNERTQSDFLTDADHFAEDYEDEIEDEGYEYEVTSGRGKGGVKDYCNSFISVPITDSPVDSPVSPANLPVSPADDPDYLLSSDHAYSTENSFPQFRKHPGADLTSNCFSDITSVVFTKSTYIPGIRVIFDYNARSENA